MKHYVDIRLLPDPELLATQLMSVLFGKLHRVLVAANSGGVGVSFPEMQSNIKTLGTVMRLHGERQVLERMLATEWLSGLRDYVQLTPVLTVPTTAKYRTVNRVQAKSNPDRLRRRQMRRHGLDAAQALERVPDSVAETLNLPFVQLRSHSTGQSFRLFIGLGPIFDKPVPGRFSAYGLSLSATVPWF